MVTAQTIQGNWNDIAGRLCQRWGQLTGNEWDEAEGRIDQLIGVIQRKTGEARDEIQCYLEEIVESTGGRFGGSRFGDHARYTAAQARDSLRTSFGKAEAAVQRHPGRSLAIAFGVGVAAGLLLSINRR